MKTFCRVVASALLFTGCHSEGTSSSTTAVGNTPVIQLSEGSSNCQGSTDFSSDGAIDIAFANEVADINNSRHCRVTTHLTVAPGYRAIPRLKGITGHFWARSDRGHLSYSIKLDEETVEQGQKDFEPPTDIPWLIPASVEKAQSTVASCGGSHVISFEFESSILAGMNGPDTAAMTVDDVVIDFALETCQ